MVKERINKYLILAIVIIVGVTASFVSFYFSYRWERQELVRVLQNIAGQYYKYIKDAAEQDFFALESFRDFYAASDEVTRDEFAAFAKGILARQPYIYELGWVPLVPGSDRAIFESRALADGITNFTFKEMDAEGNIVPAKARSRYFPIYYIAHSSRNIKGLEEILGMDIAMLPDRLALIETAIDSGKALPVQNQKTYGALYEKDGFSISSRIFLPIYRNTMPLSTVQDRRNSFQGFVVLMYRIEDIMDLALKNMPIAGIDIAIYSNSPKEKKLLYSYVHPHRGNEKTKSTRRDEKKCKDCFSWSQILPIADSEWLITYQADLADFNHQKIVLPWILLFAGFIITILYVLYLANILNRTQVVEDLVHTRTGELKEANKEWAETFDAISDFIFILSKESRILKVNTSFLRALGLNEKDVVGKKCYEIVHKTGIPWGNCPHQQTIKDSKPHTEVVDDPGLGMSLLVTTSPIIDEKGVFFGSVHIARDITNIKKTQDELAKAKQDAEDQAWGLSKANEGIKLLYKELEEKNRELVRLGQLKSSFVSMVSHELRTPLTAIKEGIGIVLDGTTGPVTDEQKDFLDTAKRNVDRLSRLINNILDFQKLDAGKMKFDYQENNINLVAKEVYQTMEPLVKGKWLDFVLQLDESIPLVKFDKDKITQVLTNLVSNAMKFTLNGSVSIITTKGANTIQVTVKDTGPGVKQEDLDKLFQYFEQIGDIKQRRGGTGLGLAICKEIVAMHNGKIWVESQYGQGTSFHFVLPIVERRI